MRAYTAQNMSVWIIVDVCIRGKCNEKKMLKILPLTEKMRVFIRTVIAIICIVMLCTVNV